MYHANNKLSYACKHHLYVQKWSTWTCGKPCEHRKILSCALNCARLRFEMCQTVLWTVPDCTLNCARLRFELCQTALWAVPDCALNCARQRRFRRLSDRQWSPDRWSNETESALANRLHTRFKASQKLFAWGSEGVWLIRAKCSWKVSCGCAAEVMVGMI